MAERGRPIGGLTGPEGLPDVVIVSPASGATVIVPGPLPVRIEVSSTSGLLESVGVTVILFSTGAPVADTTVAFDPTVGDTALTVTLVLEAFPTNTQLNLQGRARVFERSNTSEEVPITVIDCTGEPFPFCP